MIFSLHDVRMLARRACEEPIVRSLTASGCGYNRCWRPLLSSESPGPKSPGFASATAEIDRLGGMRRAIGSTRRTNPMTALAWGSDVAAQMLRRFGIPYVSLNPGASYRGLHDSVVNHLGNETPGMLLCLHEDHAVSIAHGYAKATGEPMACFLHSNVGLMHGMMGLYNAWCDRVPMIVLGATGPLDSAQAAALDRLDPHHPRPGRADPLVRQMGRPAGLARGAGGGHVPRQYRDAHGAERAGLYLPRCRIAGGQARQRAGMAGSRPLHAAGAGAPAGASGVERPRTCCKQARKPVMLIGRGRRTPEAWQARVELAERLGACVMSDLKSGSDVSDRSSGACHRAVQQCRQSGARSAVAGRRDPGARLDRSRRQRAARLRTDRRLPPRSSARRSTIRCTTASTWITRSWRRSICPIAAAPDVVVGELLDALGPGTREPWHERDHRQAERPELMARSPWSRSRSTLRTAFNDPDKVSFVSLGRGWPIDLWPLHRSACPTSARTAAAVSAPAPGLSVGAALALARARAAGRSRCAATAISSWATPRCGPRCATAFRCWC